MEHPACSYFLFPPLPEAGKPVNCLVKEPRSHDHPGGIPLFRKLEEPTEYANISDGATRRELRKTLRSLGVPCNRWRLHDEPLSGAQFEGLPK